ncbi:hypothetical protein DTO169C6_5441 [Paecilomyces variotii]|nr:hypothetical protein DTO169C6_5441 [Paecilomyces variotii]
MSKDLTKECNNYQKIIAKFTLRMRRQTPMSTYSESNCSVKLPDPPLLTDGKDPKFEDWLVQMKTDEIFSYLQAIFHNPNRADNAKQVHTSDYKREMYSKITAPTRSIAAIHYHRNTTFNEFTTLCHQAANAVKMNEYKPSNTARNNKSQNIDSADTATSVRSDNNQSTPKPKGTSSAEREILMKEGKYFYCKGKGHLGC